MTEIEKTEGEIKVLQAKLELLKEMEKHKSPVEEAFKRIYGYYPGVCERSVWIAFQKGYEAAQEDYKVGEYQPKEKEQKWDVVRESVKWCEEHPDESVEDYLKPQGPQGPVGPGPGPKGVIVGYEPTPQEPEEKEQKWDVEKLQEKNWYVDDKDLIESGTALPEPTSTVFRQKLFDGIKSVFYDPDYERTHWKMKVNMAVDEVLTHFYEVIPKSQEPVYGDFDEGWDSCLKCIEMRMEFSDD